MSNSASRNGAATLFLTTFTLVRLPTTVSPSLIAAMRRISSANRRIELQRPAARSGLRIAEHHADLLANLVDENQACVRFRDDAGQLADRLRHEPRLHAHVRITHFAVKLRFRHQRRDRIDDQNVDRPRPINALVISRACSAKSGCETSRLSTSTPEFAGIDRIECVLNVDECGHAAGLLRLCDHLQGNGGLS